jgi:hypothetical protein
MGAPIAASMLDAFSCRTSQEISPIGPAIV